MQCKPMSTLEQVSSPCSTCDVCMQHQVATGSRQNDCASPLPCPKAPTGTALTRLQAVWVFTTLLPLLVLNTGAGGPARLLATDIAGAALFGAGFLLEAVADYQKSQWRQNPSNKGKFIQEGLWAYARHPNYFGEMMLWTGVFLGCAGAFTAPLQYASVVSPLFVMLLLRYVSGVPIQAKQAQERWGHLQEYQEYVARTNLLLPLPKLKLKE